jgi:hypothetical protein
MGFLDEVGKVLDTVETATPIDIITGIKGAVTDVPSLVNDVAHGDFGKAFVDGRKVLGDGKDIALGLSSLGANLGPIPSFLENNTATKFTESKVLAAAQLLIEGMKKTTGSGTPCTGQEFRGSSKQVEDVVNTLIDAAPHADRWDGTGSQVYNAMNASHRRLASDVRAADLEIACVIDTEAGQVTRTRKSLDDTSEGLTNYDLATMWMNATPPTRVLKFGLDCTAAAGALDVAGATMAVLVANSLENAARIRGPLQQYEDAASDTSGNPLDACSGEVFPVPDQQHQPARPNPETSLPGPNEASPPTRSLPGTQFTVPGPEQPPVQTPATPYGAPASGAPR